MRGLTRFLFLGALGASAAAWACSITPDVGESSASVVAGPDRTVPLGTCTLSTMPTDLSTTVDKEPMAEPYFFDPQPHPTADQVLTKVELSAVIADGTGKRVVRSISAKIARGTTLGTLVFPVGGGKANEVIDLANTRSYSRRELLAGDTSSATLSIGDQALPIELVVLHWESTGERMVMFGHHTTDDRTLVATSSHCDFDDIGWRMVGDAACEKELFDANGQPRSIPKDGPRDACLRGPEDTFADFKASVAAGHLVSSSTPDAADASDGAVASDGSAVPPKKSGVPIPSKDDSGVRNYDDDEDDSGAATEGFNADNYRTNPLPIGDTTGASEDAPDAGATKPKQQASGCSFGASRASSSDSLALGLLALGFVAVRRRRRR